MRGHIRQRSAGSYTIYLELDPLTGKRRQETFTVRGSLDDAEQELTRLLRARDTGDVVEENKISTGDFLRRWIDSIEGSISARTAQGYRSILDKHLIPTLGNIPLRKLKPLHLQEHYAACLRDGARRDGRSGALSPQTVLHHHRLLFEALEYAVSWEYISRNPARAAKPPKIVDREVEVADAAETMWLIECAKGTSLYIPIQMAVFLGLRRGEVLGAKWSDVSWDARTITIQRAVEETRANGVKLKPPKSKRGRRTISIPALLFEALRAHRGSAKSDAFICPSPRDFDAIWTPSAFTSTYRALLRRRSLKGPGFHLLRHGHGSMLAKENMPIDDISRRLSHARSSFTLQTYIHQIGSSRDEQAADKINAIYQAEYSKAKQVQ